MGVNITNNPVFLPEVPQIQDPVLKDYLEKLRLVLSQTLQGAFANTFLVATAINKGTSGVFVVASGGHINVTSGVVTSVSTT